MKQKTNVNVTFNDRTGIDLNKRSVFPAPEKGPDPTNTGKRPQSKKELTIIYLMHHSKKKRVRKKNRKRFEEEYLFPYYHRNDIGRKAIIFKKENAMKG